MMFARGNACGCSPSALDGRIYGYGEKSYAPEDNGAAGLFGRRGYAGGIYLPAGGRCAARELPCSHLAEIDTACHERMDFLIPAMAKQEGVTEALKASNQMEWVGRMNNIRNRAEEIILHELVYA